MSQSRWAGSRYCTPAKNSDVVDSMSAAPRNGERGVSSLSGIFIPAEMRPMSMAYGCVAGAHTPAAMCAAGGEAGCDRRRRMLARWSVFHSELML